MFDPTIGRWLQEDPIDFEGGDANLYRMTGNDLLNRTDRNGLASWVTIGLIDGPECTQGGMFFKPLPVTAVGGPGHQQRAMPRIVYEQVRGDLVDIVGGCGLWSQPAYAVKDPNGTAPVYAGASSMGPKPGLIAALDRAFGREQDDSRYGGIHSYLQLYGQGADGGVCNTPLGAEGILAHAGSVRVRVVDFAPGVYRIKLHYDIRIESFKSLSAIANRWSNSGFGKRNMESSFSVPGGSEKSNMCRLFQTKETTIVIGSNGEAEVGGIQLTMSGQKNGRSCADLKLSISEITKIGK